MYDDNSLSDICISVTTFKKNAALIGWLDSLVNFGRIKVVHIADDNDGEAQPVAEEFQRRFEDGRYPFPIVYSTGPRGGISKNKNRGIDFFLKAPEAAECKYLVLSDDDIRFKESDFGTARIGDLLVEAFEKTGFEHITGYLGGSFGRVNEDGTVDKETDGFFVQFPPIAEDDYIVQCGGTQGILLFFTRRVVETVGYFTQFPGEYGYEHAEYSQRINRLFGRCQELYPVLKHCDRYFGCQGIPNNYHADPTKNSNAFAKRAKEIFVGVDLVRKNSGL